MDLDGPGVSMSRDHLAAEVLSVDATAAGMATAAMLRAAMSATNTSPSLLLKMPLMITPFWRHSW